MVVLVGLTVLAIIGVVVRPAGAAVEDVSVQGAS